MAARARRGAEGGAEAAEDNRVNDRLEDLTAVASFLAMAEKEELMLNSRTGNEAFEAFARIIGVPASKLRVLARDSTVDAIIKKAGG